MANSDLKSWLDNPACSLLHNSATYGGRHPNLLVQESSILQLHIDNEKEDGYGQSPCPKCQDTFQLVIISEKMREMLPALVNGIRTQRQLQGKQPQLFRGAEQSQLGQSHSILKDGQVPVACCVHCSPKNVQVVMGTSPMVMRSACLPLSPSASTCFWMIVSPGRALNSRLRYAAGDP